MASSIRESRLATLLSWLRTFPLLLLSEEQIGAFLLGHVPADGPLSKKDREDAQNECERAMKPHVLARDVLRIGFPVTTRHSVPVLAVKLYESVAAYRERLSSEPRGGPLRTLGSFLQLHEPNGKLKDRADYSDGSLDRYGNPSMPLYGGFVQYFDRLSPAQYLTFQGCDRVRTWCYGSSSLAEIDSFADRYVERSTAKLPVGQYVTRLVNHQEAAGGDWLQDDRDEHRRLVAEYTRDLVTIRQSHQAGDFLLSILRFAEMAPALRQILPGLGLSFELFHGISDTHEAEMIEIRDPESPKPASQCRFEVWRRVLVDYPESATVVFMAQWLFSQRVNLRVLSEFTKSETGKHYDHACRPAVGLTESFYCMQMNRNYHDELNAFMQARPGRVLIHTPLD